MCVRNLQSVRSASGHSNILSSTKTLIEGINLTSSVCFASGSTNLMGFVQCTEVDCDEVFSKHHQLRTHLCEVHSPPGTKPYICSHPGCTKSFPTNRNLRGHMKTHDGMDYVSTLKWSYIDIFTSDKRYTCSHLHCLPGLDKDPVYFGTWTALQAHIRNDHPPTCAHPKCNGRTFASQHNLRAHQKLHEQQEAEAHLYYPDEADAPEDATDAEGSRPRKRRRGGEFGRDWKCDFMGCGKDFKSVCSVSQVLDMS